MEQTKEKLPYILFGTQLALNFAWSPVFFGLQNITLAFIDVTLLLGVLVWTTIEFRKHSKEAMALLLPLVAWVAFATILTASLLALN
jgi:tryptophan-rich sensory protein